MLTFKEYNDYVLMTVYDNDLNEIDYVKLSWDEYKEMLYYMNRDN